MTGGGFGVALVSAAEYFLSAGPFREFVVVVSPAVSVLVTGMWVMLATWFVNWNGHRQLKQSIKDATELRDSVCNDGRASEGHKKEVQERLEKLQKLLMAAKSSEATGLVARFVDGGAGQDVANLQAS